MRDLEVDNRKGVRRPDTGFSGVQLHECKLVPFPVRRTAASAAPPLIPGGDLTRREWRDLLAQVKHGAERLAAEGFTEAREHKRSMRLLRRVIETGSGVPARSQARTLCRVEVALGRADCLADCRRKAGRLESPPAHLSAAAAARLHAVTQHLKAALTAVLRYLLTRDGAQIRAARAHLEDGAATFLAAAAQR